VIGGLSPGASLVDGLAFTGNGSILAAGGGQKYLLVPVPEPSTCLMGVAGMFAAGGFRFSFAGPR
jgi:hypothetical protein